LALKRKSAVLLEKVKIGPFEMDRIDWIMTAFVGGILLALLVLKLVCAPVITRGTSMEPTIHNGEVYLTNPRFTASDLTYGTVIVFKNPHGRTLVKRIEGVPGDKVQIRDGILYRNGQAVEEGFPAMEKPGLYAEETGIVMQPGSDGTEENTYFVLGDNRNNSNDSRSFGAVPYHSIKAVMTGNEPLFTIPPFFLGDGFF